VVVVDDSELTRDMLVSLLERLNFAVSEAVDGADALLLLEREKPDLVMTDLDMPVMDGFTLLERIRESPTLRDVPVIVLSTRDSDDVKRKAMKLGANAYLVKAAFRADELHRTLKHYLKSSAKESVDA
jgi:CheY-like chemotaxis protein